MLNALSDGLSSYALPFLIAVPLALLVWFCTGRRGDDVLDDAPATRSGAATRPAGPAAILIVDDSAVARAKLGKLFEAAGLKVTLAKDGVDALEQLGRQRFDVMITDLEMPNKNGFELIEAVQGSLDTEDLPVIAITGHDEMQARVHQVQGLYGIFKKPWNDRELLKRVETLAALRK
ncbi:MAG: response regulator [Pelomonas sp.]|nr:response regulator [Roseateles sp.]